MGGKIVKYFCVLLLYAMIATFPIAMISGGDKDMAGILFIAFGAMILGPFIYFDIKASKRERDYRKQELNTVL